MDKIELIALQRAPHIVNGKILMRMYACRSIHQEKRKNNEIRHQRQLNRNIGEKQQQKLFFDKTNCFAFKI